MLANPRMMKPLSTSTPSLPSQATGFVSGGSLGSMGAFVPTGQLPTFPGPAAKLLHPSSDTVQMWRNYRKQATPHRVPLERGPRFRTETCSLELLRMQETNRAPSSMQIAPPSVSTYSPESVSWAADAQCAHFLRRRNLRAQLREAKDFIDMTEKRGYVPGLVASEDVSQTVANEQRKIKMSMTRIAGAIQDCSRSRHEVMTMQKELAAVVDVQSPSKSIPTGPGNHVFH